VKLLKYVMFELTKIFAILKTWKSHFPSLKHSKCLSLSALYVVLMLRGGANGAPVPGIQRVKLQNMKCCNWMIFPIVSLLIHTVWI